MGESYESILEAARRLSAEQQRRLAERLLEGVRDAPPRPTADCNGARRLFGTWASGDGRSADNDRIDRDLAREYGGPR